MNDFMVIVLSYAGVFVLSMVVMNFLMTGFFITYMRVKGSRGKLMLINVFAVNRNYYRSGKVEDGFLVYKDANKHEKRLKIPQHTNIFYRSLNVTCANVDEERNVFISPSGQDISGFDAEKLNNLYLRTLYRPEILDPKTQLMFVLSIINTLLGLVTIAILMAVVSKKLDTIINIVATTQNYFVGLNTTII